VTVSDSPRVLVVEHSPGVRRLLRTAFEIEGATVVEAETLAEARRATGDDLDVVVLDRRLSDGDGIALTIDLSQSDGGDGPLIVLHTDVPDEDDGRTVGHASVRRGDVVGVVERVLARGLLHAERPGDDDLPRIGDEAITAVVEHWRELCRWDPSLPDDTAPAGARELVTAMALAARHPQPLGWGLDPFVEPEVPAFAAAPSSIDHLVSQLICLRVAWEQTLADAGSEEQRVRLRMLVERTMAAVVDLRSSQES
jgi:CheY-like chemotaxis protein